MGSTAEATLRRCPLFQKLTDESLEVRLANLQKSCHDIGEALALQYFHAAPWVAWSDTGQRPLAGKQGRS